MDKPRQQQQPPTLSLQDILANALNSTIKQPDTKAGLETKNCTSCGAARPADTDLRYCDFCQTPFY